MMLTLETLVIPRAPQQSELDISRAAALFADAPELTFSQAWLCDNEPNFAPARARVVASERELWVWADLNDDLPCNAATSPNQNTWELGDCFEIFLASRARGPYYEMHVTPENQTLQLKFAESGSDFQSSLLDAGPLRSATHLTATGWQILAALPLALLEDGARGWLSLSRYDYQSGQREPVISSSSPHRQPNFHRRHEWTPFEIQ